MALYESEHTKFMREWMAKHPEQAEEQRKGRALWWDKPQQVARQQEIADATLAQKPYCYQTEN